MREKKYLLPLLLHERQDVFCQNKNKEEETLEKKGNAERARSALWPWCVSGDCTTWWQWAAVFGLRECLHAVIVVDQWGEHENLRKVFGGSSLLGGLRPWSMSE
jgi:hypothetical protein